MMLTLPSSPIPTIEISFAPPEEPQPEPFSPFTPMHTSFQKCGNGGFCERGDDDAYRPSLLTPPPIHAPGINSLCGGFPGRAPGQGRGIADADFAALLKASKDRSAAASAKRQQDLRKEVTLKAHKHKQAERRALFLSKVGAPPSPSAVSTPKTPPESPAVFHYSLPSPGLSSPLAIFDDLYEDSEDCGQIAGLKPWVERIDFRLPASRNIPVLSPSHEDQQTKRDIPSISVIAPDDQGAPRRSGRPGHASKSSLPSLDQITERFCERGSHASSAPTPRVRPPLPAFLSSRQLPTKTTSVSVGSKERENGHATKETRGGVETVSPPSRPRTLRLASTGRIQFPARSSPSPPAPAPAAAPASLPVGSARRRLMALSSAQALPILPRLPLSPKMPTTQLTPMNVHRGSSNFSGCFDTFAFGSGPKLERASLTEANLAALESRAKTARDMLSAVRRRATVVVPAKGHEKFRFIPPSTSRPLVHASLEDSAVETLRKLGAGAYAHEFEKMQRRNSAPAELVSAKRRNGTAFSHPALALPGGF